MADKIVDIDPFKEHGPIMRIIVEHADGHKREIGCGPRSLTGAVLKLEYTTGVKTIMRECFYGDFEWRKGGP